MSVFIANLLFVSFGSHATYALTFDTGGYNTILKLGTLPPDQAVVKIVAVLLALVGLLALIMILWGGFMWLLSAGSPERLRKARDILFAAIVGLAIIMAAYGIVSYVFGKLNEATGAPVTFVQRVYRA